MTELEHTVQEFTSSYEKALQDADHRPWGHPAPLPDHPLTHSDRHPDDPDHIEMFMQYF